jgi:hypothetical protein
MKDYKFLFTHSRLKALRFWLCYPQLQIDATQVVLPNISQRTKSAFHYSFWQMNTIVMGFLFVLGKIEIILSYSQYPSSSIKAPMDLCYRIACRNIVGHYLQVLHNILAEAKLYKVILPILSH